MTTTREPDGLPDLPIEHVQRPQPPWRATRLLTECGRPVEDVTVISRELLVAKVKKLGQQRAAYTTCMVCWDKSRYDHAWDKDPVGCLMREAARHEHRALRYATATVTIAGQSARPDDADQRTIDAIHFRNELLAIAALIEEHRDEFDEICDGLAATGDLAARRTARRAAERHAKGSRR